MILDHAVKMDINEVQTRRSAPMTQQSWLDVLAFERLSKKRIGKEINLADRKVVRCTPVGVHLAWSSGLRGPLAAGCPSPEVSVPARARTGALRLRDLSVVLGIVFPSSSLRVVQKPS